MKTKGELTALKEKVETENKKRYELTEEELLQVTGGTSMGGGIEIPVIATDKKGDIIVFKIDAPAVEEADVVELNIANLIFRGEVLVSADIDIPE